MGKHSIEGLIGEEAHIAVPDRPIPVVAYFSGERTVIGEGTIDPESGVFASTLDLNNPHAKAVYDQLVDMEHFSLPIRISEVEVYKRSSE